MQSGERPCGRKEQPVQARKMFPKVWKAARRVPVAFMDARRGPDCGRIHSGDWAEGSRR